MAKPKTLAEFFDRPGAPTQVSLAQELGISEGHMSRIISGQAQPSLPLAVRIADLSGVPVESLLKPAQEASA